jgi:hypothetical protein
MHAGLGVAPGSLSYGEKDMHYFWEFSAVLQTSDFSHYQRRSNQRCEGANNSNISNYHYKPELRNSLQFMYQIIA